MSWPRIAVPNHLERGTVAIGVGDHVQAFAYGAWGVRNDDGSPGRLYCPDAVVRHVAPGHGFGVDGSWYFHTGAYFVSGWTGAHENDVQLTQDCSEFVLGVASD